MSQKREKLIEIKLVKIDLKLELKHTQSIFDIKTAKPNISNFKDFKRTLLEWVAVVLFEKP